MSKHLMLVVLLLFFIGCKEPSLKKEVVRSVKSDVAKVYEETENTTYPGKVIPSLDINLAFQIGGPILHVNNNIGSYVRKGQILAQINPRNYEIQLAATEAEYNRIKAEVERIIELHEKGSATPNEYDKAVYSLQQVAAKYEAHKNALTDTKLLAPCDGYIQKHFFELGETVNAGTPVVSMVNAGTGEIEVNIPSSDYTKRDYFSSFFCTAGIYPQKKIALELISITRKANLNQLYTARFRPVSSNEDVLTLGMSVMITIQYKPTDIKTVAIPLTSVFEIGSKSMVWVYDLETETVSSRSITLSEILSDGIAVVSSGLSAGEIVLSAGIHSVKNGEKVKLLPPISSTNIGGML